MGDQSYISTRQRCCQSHRATVGTPKLPLFLTAPFGWSSSRSVPNKSVSFGRAQRSVLQGFLYFLGETFASISGPREEPGTWFSQVTSLSFKKDIGWGCWPQFSWLVPPGMESLPYKCAGVRGSGTHHLVVCTRASVWTMSGAWVEEGDSDIFLSCSCLEYSFCDPELWETRYASGLSLLGTSSHSPRLVLEGKELCDRHIYIYQ